MSATIPFPSAETTPPVTKTYFGARALTGFQGSSRSGSPLCGGLHERVQTLERALRVAAREADQPRSGDLELDLGALLLDGAQAQTRVEPVAGQLEGDPFLRLDV